jgi:hypothetical protein
MGPVIPCRNYAYCAVVGATTFHRSEPRLWGLSTNPFRAYRSRRPQRLTGNRLDDFKGWLLVAFKRFVLLKGRCSVTSARMGPTFPQCQAARIVIRHPFNPAPHPQHYRRLALSNDLAHDENPAAAVGTRIETAYKGATIGVR